MNTTTVITLTFAVGVIAGLRALTAPMVVSWAAHLTWFDIGGSWAAFLGYAATPYVFTVLAIAELVNDKLPKTPSRKAPPSFVIRVISGAFSGAALATAARQPVALGVVCGGLGAVAGTLGGYEARTRLVKALHAPDIVIALIEDAVAVGGGFLIVSRL
jgi:uncharacterized membrane protein